MNKNRMYFKDNPWPQGHPIKKFEWSASVHDEDVWFNMHLESEDYSEHDMKDDKEKDDKSDWEAPIVWFNYHACKLSSNYFIQF